MNGLFIKRFSHVIFKILKLLKIIFFVFSSFCLLAQQQLISGKVLETDSTSTLPFVYIINKSNGNGTMSDNEGRFSLYTNIVDTLVCSFTGFARTYIPVKDLLNGNPPKNVKLIMGKLPIFLNTVTITAFKIKPYERDYMNKIIDESRIKTLDYIGSPITALYMRYSQEGRQIRKLAKIFEDILIEEQVQKKLSADIVKKLTGDEEIDYEAFRKYCYNVGDQFILSHEGVELYSKVMECYKRWKKEKGTGYKSFRKVKNTEE
jgi:hypothetical protein